MFSSKHKLQFAGTGELNMSSAGKYWNLKIAFKGFKPGRINLHCLKVADRLLPNDLKIDYLKGIHENIPVRFTAIHQEMFGYVRQWSKFDDDKSFFIYVRLTSIKKVY